MYCYFKKRINNKSIKVSFCKLKIIDKIRKKLILCLKNKIQNIFQKKKKRNE